MLCWQGYARCICGIGREVYGRAHGVATGLSQRLQVIVFFGLWVSYPFA